MVMHDKYIIAFAVITSPEKNRLFLLRAEQLGTTHILSK